MADFDDLTFNDLTDAQREWVRQQLEQMCREVARKPVLDTGRLRPSIEAADDEAHPQIENDAPGPFELTERESLAIRLHHQIYGGGE